MYEVQTNDFYQDMLEFRDFFDLSDYAPESHFYDPTNKKVIGKFKDETKGDPILEFIGLRPKMYSFQTVKMDVDSREGAKIEEKHRAKGIARAVAARLRHSDYLKQFEAPEENYLVNRRLGAKLHRIHGIEV